MTDNTRIYISGKITGTTDYIERFNKAEIEMIKEGHETVNPATLLDHLPPTTTHKEYMHVSYALLDICDGIYLMEGWKDSVGAVLEYDYALEKGMVVLEEELTYDI